MLTLKFCRNSWTMFISNMCDFEEEEEWNGYEISGNKWVKKTIFLYML